MMQTLSKDESIIQEALSLYNLKLASGANPNISKIAKDFIVNYQRLYARIRGRGTYTTRKSNRRRLYDA
jgi:hypothetical protein